jgi:hypothetical protein
MSHQNRPRGSFARQAKQTLGAHLQGLLVLFVALRRILQVMPHLTRQLCALSTMGKSTFAGTPIQLALLGPFSPKRLALYLRTDGTIFGIGIAVTAIQPASSDHQNHLPQIFATDFVHILYLGEDGTNSLLIQRENAAGLLRTLPTQGSVQQVNRIVPMAQPTPLGMSK